MAKKNHISKTVFDLMGLQGNENAAKAKAQDAVEEAVFELKKRIDVTVGSEAEPEKESQFQAVQGIFPNSTSTTVISKSMEIIGEIASAGDIDIYGDVKGSIKSDGNIQATGKIVGDMAGKSLTLDGCTLQGNITARENITIGLNTIVVGDIVADSINVNGKVKGNLTISKSSEFLENALLAGDVHSQTISMNQGAKFHGNISVALDSSQSEKEFDSISRIQGER